MVVVVALNHHQLASDDDGSAGNVELGQNAYIGYMHDIDPLAESGASSNALAQWPCWCILMIDHRRIGTNPWQ
jgi:hypothetical protein